MRFGMGRNAKNPPKNLSLLEFLEPRRLLCEGPNDFAAPVEIGGTGALMPGDAGPLATNPSSDASAASPATIIWTNRGSLTNDSDRFNSVFGVNADLARGVVDGVIQSYMRMITSFNYSDGSNTYSLSLSMSATGTSLGASASMQTTLGGKPRSGTITMGRGHDLNADGIGDGADWFLDPTPLENSEFQGDIVNAFSGDAQSGSPAFNKSDFFTVVAAEMTHCMGLYGGTGAVPLWDAHTTATGVPDTAEGGGASQFWIFQGPSIKHLLTGYNSGNPNSFNGGVHSAGPNVLVTFGSDVYVGAQDQGNARYEYARRYMIDDAFALMFKDAYGYTTVDPDQFGTMYSNLNTITGNLLVRGNTLGNNSDDQITITQSGSTLTVAVDVGTEIGGIGALPGTGNLPAFVSTYDISQVSSITIQAGDGNDTIDISGMSATVPISISGGDGNDALNINDGAATGNNSYAINSISVTKQGAGTITYDTTIEKLALTAGSGTDLINVTGATIPVTIMPSGGLDSLIVNGASASIPGSAQLGALTIGAAGLVTLPDSGAIVLGTRALSLIGNGSIDIADNAMVIDYSGTSPLGNVITDDAITSWIVSGYNGGSWNGAGIRSSKAAAIGSASGIGYGEATDVFASFPATFVGQSVDASSVLIRYTTRGDASLNQIVDSLDFNVLTANWGGTGSFTRGDFSYDGTINSVDFNLIAGNFAGSLPGASALAQTSAAPLATGAEGKAPPLLGNISISLLEQLDKSDQPKYPDLLAF